MTYYGKRNTVITYVLEEHKWLMYLTNDNITRAESEASLQTFAMGNNMWSIKNDYDCSLRDTKTVLSLTTCGPDKYTCNDGLCIDMLKRCDSWPDCIDKSDELNCRKINTVRSYQKHISPPGHDGSDKLEIKVSIDLVSIVNIDEVASIFQVQFTLHLSWYDSRLTFDNLKNNTWLNTLSPREKDSIWFPELFFLNTEHRPSVMTDNRTAIMVKKLGNFELSAKTELENTHVYSGRENPLLVSRFYNIKFLCSYDMHWTPFNIQKCHIILAMEVLDTSCIILLKILQPSRKIFREMFNHILQSFHLFHTHEKLEVLILGCSC